MPKPPTYTYTPQQFSDLVDECIAKCKDPDDDYQPCPEQLYSHTKLSKQSISLYRNAKETDTAYPYRDSAERFYNYLGIFACKDNLEGNGRQGAHLYNRVLKYSEKQDIDHTHKGDVYNPLAITVQQVKPKQLSQDEKEIKL